MNSSEIKFTSIDYYINKFRNKIEEDIFDLEKLALTFDLTDNYSKLEYSEKKGKGSIEKLINRPPIGPIPENFMCTYCLQYGPDNHLIRCPNPSKRSLVLTFKGFKEILKDTDYTGPLEEDINNFKKGNRLEILEKYFGDDIEKVKEGKKTIIKIPDTAFSEITYDEVVKIKGKDPLGPKTLTVRFSNMVSIYYTYNEKTANIRVYRDGSIDIKNIPEDLEFIEELINKINRTDALLIDNYKKLLVKNRKSITNIYKKYDDYSYYYLFHAQFYMFGQETRKEQEINFEELEDIIETENNNKYIQVVDSENYLRVQDYDIKILSKSKSETGKKILKEVTENKVYILSFDDINISLFITKYGVFQFTVSSTELNKEETREILEIIRNYFINIFENNDITEKTYITQEPLIYSMHETQDTTISGLIPPKSESQRTGTEVCRKTQAGVKLQPRPYSWTGNCAAENYAPAIGIAKKYQGGDIKINYNGKEQQLYYPCCEKLIGKTKLEFIKRLKEGFTPEEQKEYGIYPDRDILSGVLVPDSTKLGAIAEVTLPGENNYTQVEVVKIPKKITQNAEYEVKRISDSKIFKIQRNQFKRDSRYFRGLNSLNKKELISILIKENMITQGKKINIESYKNKINFKYIRYQNFIEDFTEKVYKLTFVPDNTTLVILEYKNVKEQFYININTGIKLPSSVRFVEGTSLIAYYNESTKELYPLYINGIEDLETNQNLIDKNLIGINDTIKELNFIDNYIEAADYYLKNENNIRLLFIPKNLKNDMYYYDEKLIPPPIIVQFLERIPGSKNKFGYDKQLFTEDSYQLVIPSKINKFDYIKIKGNYNKITGEIDSLKPFEYVEQTKREDKTFEKAQLQFLELLNPINIIFFTINDGEFLTIDGKNYNYNEDTELLNPM